MQPEGDGAPRRRRVRPSISPRGRQLLKTPIADWEVGLLQDMVRSEFDLRVMSVFGRPPSQISQGKTRFVMLGGALYDLEAIQRIYRLNAMMADLDAVAGAVDAFEAPSNPPRRIHEAARRWQHRAFWPLLRDAALAEANSSLPVVIDERSIGPRMAQLAPDLFLTYPLPQMLPHDVVSGLVADGKLEHLSTDVRRRLMVVRGTPDSLQLLRTQVLHRWEPARRKPSRKTGPRKRKT